MAQTFLGIGGLVHAADVAYHARSTDRLDDPVALRAIAPKPYFRARAADHVFAFELT